MDDWEKYVLDRLNRGKPWMTSTYDMGQGMLHNSSDFYRCAVAQFSSRMAQMKCEKEFNCKIDYKLTSTSDDHSSILRVCRSNEDVSVSDIIFTFYQFKWYVQICCGLILSEKSCYGEGVCEIKSEFISSGRLRHTEIKQVSGQLFIIRIPWSEPYYNQAISFGRSILAENGNMVMVQLVMNTLNNRVSGQVKTEPGGLNRKGIPGEIKF